MATPAGTVGNTPGPPLPSAMLALFQPFHYTPRLALSQLSPSQPSPPQVVRLIRAVDGRTLRILLARQSQLRPAHTLAHGAGQLRFPQYAALLRPLGVLDSHSNCCHSNCYQNYYQYYPVVNLIHDVEDYLPFGHFHFSFFGYIPPWTTDKLPNIFLHWLAFAVRYLFVGSRRRRDGERDYRMTLVVNCCIF
jgi:hypothetical protein